MISQRISPRIISRDNGVVAIIIIIICIAMCIDYVETICGIDHMTGPKVKEGEAEIEKYPWLGVLVYPYGRGFGVEPMTATVVLITEDLAIAAALEIDKYPKYDFRANSRVMMGNNCSGPYIRIMEYTFHPDFGKSYYNALALIQLRPNLKTNLIPICAPPTFFEEMDIYAMSLTHGCSSSMVTIYKMEYINIDKCREYYRRNDLDVESMWPRHVSCAQGMRGGDCLWKSGTVLVTKQAGTWRLLGFGVHGPGCKAPARFIDYEKYHKWVQQARRKVGKVAITRMAPDHLIIRRSMQRVQRFGLCDPEEVHHLMFRDETQVVPRPTLQKFASGHVAYNLTLFDRTDYSCIIIRVAYENDTRMSPRDRQYKANVKLRQWCRSETVLCAQSELSTIFFAVEITFYQKITYQITVWGIRFMSIDPKRIMYWANQKRTYRTFKYWRNPYQTYVALN